MTDFFERDDGSLTQGLANLATRYFDTTSEYNRTHQDKKKHIDFQQFNGRPWSEIVKSILGGEGAMQDMFETGTSVLKQTIKTGATVLTDSTEVASGTFLIGALTDLVIDEAVDMFKKKIEIFETYEKGQWIYIDRGKEQSKEKMIAELNAESALFGDYDSVLEADQATRMYSPGFYIEGLPSTSQHVVYAFDTQESLTVTDGKVRAIREKPTLVKFDNDEAMTTIRELYLVKQARVDQQYYPYQIGDEVIHDGKLYVVRLNDENGVIIKNKITDKTLRVDQQSLKPGPRSHWQTQKEGDFRTAVGTFSRGTFAYRRIQPGDKPPNKSRAKGVLCIVSYRSEEKVQVIDCWDASFTTTGVNDIIQPTIECRKQMHNYEPFKRLQRAVIHQEPLYGLELNKTDYEWLCWGYEQKIPFSDINVYSGEDIPKQETMAPLEIADTFKSPQPKPPKELETNNIQPATVGLFGILLALLFLL